jgi:hypothetical protein
MTSERRHTLGSEMPHEMMPHEMMPHEMLQIAFSHLVPKFAWFIVDGDVVVLQIFRRKLEFL